LIDIHSHVLPGVDDGAPDLETAVRMCRMAAESGTTDLAATPHNNLRYPWNEAAVRRGFEELRKAVGDLLHLHLGCDLHLSFDNIGAALEDPARYSINGNGYVLVEFSDSMLIQGTAGIFARFRQAGLRPVVTHPERNHHLRRNLRRLSAWVERGCLFQITGQSLLGHFGERARDAALQMMDAGLVHFVASDGHSLDGRPPVLREALDFVLYRWGEAAAQRLFIDHPWAALWGEKIEPPAPQVKRRSLLEALLKPKKRRRRRAPRLPSGL